MLAGGVSPLYRRSAVLWCSCSRSVRAPTGNGSPTQSMNPARSRRPDVWEHKHKSFLARTAGFHGPLWFVVCKSSASTTVPPLAAVDPARRIAIAAYVRHREGALLFPRLRESRRRDVPILCRSARAWSDRTATRRRRVPPVGVGPFGQSHRDDLRTGLARNACVRRSRIRHEARRCGHHCGSKCRAHRAARARRSARPTAWIAALARAHAARSGVRVTLGTTSVGAPRACAARDRAPPDSALRLASAGLCGARVLGAAYYGAVLAVFRAMVAKEAGARNERPCDGCLRGHGAVVPPRGVLRCTRRDARHSVSILSSVPGANRPRPPPPPPGWCFWPPPPARGQ